MNLRLPLLLNGKIPKGAWFVGMLPCGQGVNLSGRTVTPCPQIELINYLLWGHPSSTSASEFAMCA